MDAANPRTPFAPVRSPEYRLILPDMEVTPIQPEKQIDQQFENREAEKENRNRTKKANNSGFHDRVQ